MIKTRRKEDDEAILGYLAWQMVSESGGGLLVTFAVGVMLQVDRRYGVRQAADIAKFSFHSKPINLPRRSGQTELPLQVCIVWVGREIYKNAKSVY